MKLSRVLMGLLLVQVAQASELELTKESLAKWVETRELCSLEKEHWVLQQEVLADRIDLVASERDRL